MMASRSRALPALAALGFCTLAWTTVRAEEDSDILRFFGGDILHGKMLSAESGKRLLWARDDARKPIPVKPDNIRQVKLSTPDSGDKRYHATSVRLSNGDLLRGDLVSLDETNLVMDTWYAGKLTVDRLVLQGLFPGKRTSLSVYEGPNNIEEWTLNTSGAWRFENGALYTGSSGIAGKDVKLPPSSRIDFTVHWKGPHPQFRFAFYTDNLQSYSRNSYTIRASSSYIRLYRYQNNSSTSLASAYPQMQFSKGQCRYTILTDQKAKTITVLINDQMVKQWQDAAGFKKLGTGILFYGYSNPQLKVSDIRVTAWDGALPGSEREGEAAAEDFLELTNNDRISGQVKGIKDNQLSLLTSYATLTIPMDRIASVAFSAENAERARRNATDIQARLKSGALITLDLERIDKEKVHGSSENFGSIAIERNALEGIRFNLYREDEEDDGDSW